MALIKLLLASLAITSVCGMYSKKDDVVELTEANFQSKVINSDDIWIVEFYAPWCGHCKSLVPEYKKAASALKGVAKVGAVDMTQHQSVGGPYNVQGFPTLKIFGADKKKPTDYNGQRTAQAIADSVLAEAKKAVSARLGGKSSGSSSSGSGSGSGKRGGGGSGNEVVELTDANFEDLVLNSKDIWLVEFFAPWCGHCKSLEPQWKAAASELKGKVRLGALDATVHTVVANKFAIRGFPTIKYFAPGSDVSDAQDYDGGRQSSDIVAWASARAQENMPAPEVFEGINQQVVEDACKEKQLCIFAFLPHILDCQSECRNNYLAMLKEQSEKFKKNLWGWIWVEGAAQPALEESFEVGGFGYPAMTALNFRKNKYAVLKGSFGKDGIHEFLRDLSYGKGRTSSLRGDGFPKIQKTEKWDGKDGALPAEDDIDLSDIDLDKTEL
ncbi:Protein disulfide-isomerase A6 homolog [Caenorhabditis elegans]|uniref:Protein disulfide-isomerase A6 homolog n=1 Tax=Caenorhabditis elegans TaxID=6239 RepID=PDIA6_CAEEL|nr:Protein disulfide-isomerase A6 homolog [Caenorhabditis elegans]Q11067.1 RecName: Full=Protein disulfide-isomerase A6 homolog; Flags: Precursor [Caenorhabditis elegans]CCD61843.1 Protein disulfide-isomerase A6 homolog [Caenorhabditis elegans]|eukprot:NP_509190.1 Protein disulfide-isomerase A6 homolog [Caenorhabditis elegans]